MSEKSTAPEQVYPEGKQLKSFVNKRNRWGLIWRVVFMASTVVAIIALMALLYNIITGSLSILLWLSYVVSISLFAS